jgi:hypothetical protein
MDMKTPPKLQVDQMPASAFFAYAAELLKVHPPHLKYNADGSLDLQFQNESPGGDMEPNWLPASKGPFNLTMRLCAPRMEALTGRWSTPPVVRE